MKSEPITENVVDSKVELLKHLGSVQSRVNRDINSDYLYAILEDQDKEGITTMTSLAFYIKNLLIKTANKYKEYHYDHKTKKYTHRTIPIEKQNQIKRTAERIFDAFMIKNIMCVNLNRNKKDNYLAKMLAEQHEEDNDPDDEKLKQKLKELATKEEK